ncbi:MAG: glycoside hydrolase [Fibrobacter sp.]|nr:glycoside hydrolase [Fibrobacter sp.]
MRFIIVLLLSCLTAFAQIEPTPFELIRPVFPLSWDSTIFDQYVPGMRSNSVPTNLTPAAYEPNAPIPDTLNQAYLDAINLNMSPIRVNQAGYLPSDPEKMIYYVGNASTFEVVDSSGTTVLGTGTFEPTGTSTESHYKIVAGVNAERDMNIRYSVENFGPKGSLQKGFLPGGLPEETRMRIKVGNDFSATFIISDRIYSMVRDATLKFYGINRSGDSESWFHPPSHTQDGGGPIVGGQGGGGTGTPGSMSGGWYDCGDHLKESLTQSYAFMVLSVMHAADPTRDEDNYAYNHSEIHNTDGIPDILREAKHGADYALKAYDFANGVIDNMPLSVGNFGADHGWWGRPENQDFIPTSITGRGGPHERDLRLGEVGSTVGAQFAAGLAILSVHYEVYDPEFAAKALKVAKELYVFAKELALGTSNNANNTLSTFSSSAYNGNNEYYDDLGLAAIALLYATQDTMYLYDAVENPALSEGQNKHDFMHDRNGAGAFRGGWFAHKEPTLLKSGKNTSWANAYTYTLYAFYKLILSSADRAAQYGIDNNRRLAYIEDVILTMVCNLGDMSLGSASTSITLPSGVIMWKQSQVKYDPIWFTMFTDQTWIYNRYQAGNIFEVMAYADIAKDLEGLNLPNMGAQDWKSKEMQQLGINQLNYMLGMNPWDLSMLLGVGDKNDAHPHHRSANPEGKNVPGAPYKYRPPTGALYGGIPAGGTNSMVPASMSWEDYHLSETCIDGTASFIAPTIVAAKSEDLMRPPSATVEIKYVGFDSAIVVVRQDRFGTSTINFGTSPEVLDQSVSSDTPNSIHTIILKPLQNGTEYFFTVSAYNQQSGNHRVIYAVDSTQTPFTFTTLASPPASADIQNVKVCNVSADSAEIMWFTPNGEYESKIYWDTVLTSYDNMRWSKSGDESGVPTRFHYMKIGGLQEKTTYYYVVESNGVRKAVDDNGQPLQFTTPVTQYDFEVRTYEYDIGGMQFINFNIFNNEERAFDSLTLRLYVNATEAQMSNCQIMFDSDICQAYNEAGFNLPCENDREIRDLLRGAKPQRLDDTYNPQTSEYSWYIPLNLGSTTIKSSSRLRQDIRLSGGIGNRNPDGSIKCDPMVTPAAKRFSAAGGDWSWMPHSRAQGDPVDYVGMPTEDKEFGDADMAPVNPYIVVYRKDEFVWGFSPSYQEQITKRSDYKITTTFQAPFNVSNGARVELDAASSTIYVKGTAHVTEAGSINSIWVNGSPLSDEEVQKAAIYNYDTEMFDLNIPVRMGIGGNKVDITVFAGPDLSCAECQEFGGCAFTNHNFFVQFSRGELTASTLIITDVATGKSVTSPAEPGAINFNITVRDDDKIKAKTPSVPVLVINARKGDTLKVDLKFNDNGVFSSSSPISGVPKAVGSTGKDEIVFFAGDTIIVRYVDPDDDEDVSEQSFYAESKTPALTVAKLLDSDCDDIPDMLELHFSQAFGPGDKLDTINISVDNPLTGGVISFTLINDKPVTNLATIQIPIPTSANLTTNAAPSGEVSVKMHIDGIGAEDSKVKVTDGILPKLIGVSILENIDRESEQDTIMISFNEPVSLQSRSTWPLAVYNSQGEKLNTASITVVDRANTENDGQSWLFAITGNTNGSLIDSGYFAEIDPSFLVNDNALNSLDPNGCDGRVMVIEVPKPVPVNVAIMKDVDGNGYPEVLYMEFARKLRDKDMLDSFVVSWGNPAIQRSLLPSKARQWNLDYKTRENKVGVFDANGDAVLDANDMPIFETQTDTFSVLELEFDEKIFPFGTTHGHRNGRGRVKPRLGPAGGFFEVEYSVSDSVGPVLTAARLSNMRSGMDSLGLVVSEPVDTTGGVILLRRRSGNVSEIIPAVSMRLGNDSLFIFFFDKENAGTVRIGDFVRLYSEPVLSGLVDRANILPAPNAPWIQVKGVEDDKVDYKISVHTPVVGRDPDAVQQGYGPHAPDPDDYFRITVNLPGENTMQNISEGSTNMFVNKGVIYDTTAYNCLGTTFKVEINLPWTDHQYDGDKYTVNYQLSIVLNIYDQLGQFVNGTKLRFNLDDIGREYISDDGTLSLNFEWLSHDGSGPKSKSGRIVGSGSYVGRFNFTTSYMAMEDEKVPLDDKGVAERVPAYRRGSAKKSHAEKTSSFGVIRVH